jgi:hypothetical protein
MIKEGVVKEGRTPCVCGKPVAQVQPGKPVTCGCRKCDDQVKDMTPKAAASQGRIAPR